MPRPTRRSPRPSPTRQGVGVRPGRRTPRCRHSGRGLGWRWHQPRPRRNGCPVRCRRFQAFSEPATRIRRSASFAISGSPATRASRRPRADPSMDSARRSHELRASCVTATVVQHASSSDATANNRRGTNCSLCADCPRWRVRRASGGGPSPAPGCGKFFGVGQVRGIQVEVADQAPLAGGCRAGRLSLHRHSPGPCVHVAAATRSNVSPARRPAAVTCCSDSAW